MRRKPCAASGFPSGRAVASNRRLITGHSARETRSYLGLRHGFGVHAISSGEPLNILSKWMGHATLELTSIYANTLGAEEQGIAARMWT